MTNQEKERAWQFLTLLSNNKHPTVSLFAYEKKKLEALLPSLQPTNVITNSEGDITAYIYNREAVIKGLKLKYNFHSKNINE